MIDKKVFFLVSLFLVSSIYPQVEFTSSNLPIFIINTSGKRILDDPKIPAILRIVDNNNGQRNNVIDSLVLDEINIAIEIRGNSSQMFPKLQYGFETIDSSGEDLNISLLGMPKESDWILYGSYDDKTLIRNVLAHKIYNDLGRYSTRTKYCELILNGNYVGVYILMEKIKRDKNRVNIKKMEKTDITGDALTGGYIIKIDKRDDNEKYWVSSIPPMPGSFFKTEYIYVTPDEEKITPEQSEYIKNYIMNFESMLNTDSSTDLFDNYVNLIDIDSFVDFFLVNEIAKNVDGYRFSTYLYKDRDSEGGKLSLGPIWDFDLSFGMPDYDDAWKYEGWQSKYRSMSTALVPFWGPKLMDNPIFKNIFAKRWNQLKGSILSYENLAAFIDQKAENISEARERNFVIWDECFNGSYIWPNKNKFTSYSKEMDYFKNWINQRLSWMDKNISSEYSDIEWIDNSETINIDNYDDNGIKKIPLSVFYTSNQNVDSVLFKANSPHFSFIVASDTLYIKAFATGDFVIHGAGWKNKQIVSISPAYRINSTMVGVSENISIPTNYKLYQNYPNPFNPSTEIKFEIPAAGHVSLKIFDLMGREVAGLINENKEAGFYSANLNAVKYRMSSGIYFYQLTWNGISQTKSMVILK